MEEITASFLMKYSAAGTGIGLAIVFAGLLMVGIGTNYLKRKKFDFELVGICVAVVGGCTSVMSFFVLLIALFWRMIEWMLT